MTNTLLLYYNVNKKNMFLISIYKAESQHFLDSVLAKPESSYKAIEFKNTDLDYIYKKTLRT